MIQFPPSTLVGKPVPKTAFYKHLEVNARLKARFVEDIERIVWLAKIAPSTLNVDDGKEVHEITVFQVLLKNEDVPDDAFLAIDGKMPRHAVFLLQHEGLSCLLLNYKQWIDPGKGTFRIIRSFRTPWKEGEEIRLTINGPDMDRIYESFAGQISGYGTDNAADMKRVIDLQARYEQKRRMAEALQKKVRAERQFNRQMQLNGEAREVKKEMEALRKEIESITNISK